MKALALATAAFVAVSNSGQAAAPDELCARLRTFEAAQLPNGERRWVEFHWGFDQSPVSVWSWACRHSADQLAKTTCDWLMHHTNQEFTMSLPHRVMACHGYRLPKMAHYDWDRVAGTIRLRGPSDRRILMDLNYRDLPNGEQAMRLSVAEDNKTYEPDELPPIQPMPADTQKASH
jgi:hypothetical protein